MRRSRFVFSVLLAMVTVAVASDNEKRAPSGFQGVRGKKSIQDTFQDNTLVETGDQIDKRVPSSGFMGMRGKKLFPERNDFSDLSKRAPMGFLGMRGKKEYEMINSMDEFEKRAPMGFLGMRGKKESEMYDEEPSFYLDKRAPSGFMGMRGKKEYTPYEEEKRAPSSGFFGMRGKKQPGKSAFFGMRGKKYPYDLRGKFVGVRGKKQINENEIPEIENMNNDDIENYMSDLDLNQLMFLLSQGDRDAISWEKRKGPSGFMGMRG